MTEKEKAIEDETIELPTGPAEKKKPHRGRIVVITVAALALLAAGGIAWRTHEDRLMAEARADCAAESERLRVATTAYDALLNGKAASMAKTDVKSVKDAKTLDVLSKAMKASTPKTVSCKADSRPGVQDATKGVTANASWYKAHTKSLNGLVNAVETSKLDKTVDDANALYKETDGRVADDKTRASLLDAIRKRDADAIAKAVKEVNESKAAKEKADAEAKAKAEQEAAAAAAAQQQAQASQSQSAPQRQTPSYSGGSQSQSQGSSGSGSGTGRRPSSGGSSSSANTVGASPGWSVPAPSDEGTGLPGNDPGL
ncbi:MAG: colicin transporter [Bifidobacterium bifidum]